METEFAPLVTSGSFHTELSEHKKRKYRYLKCIYALSMCILYNWVFLLTDKQADKQSSGSNFQWSNWQKSPVQYWFIKTQEQVFIQKMMAWLKLNDTLNEIKVENKIGKF